MSKLACCGVLAARRPKSSAPWSSHRELEASVMVNARGWSWSSQRIGWYHRFFFLRRGGGESEGGGCGSAGSRSRLNNIQTTSIPSERMLKSAGRIPVARASNSTAT
ncbi:hypothetical protein B0H12DRAFT_1151402 [Mycena haematopus]|nr:hypothetical protein B0H12DRAFT_1151402 [Mycena haematopus]